MISDQFTYGIEIEVMDADTTISPEKFMGSWNQVEYEVVNSDGSTNKTSNLGGEFNLIPSNSIEEQIELLKEFKKTYPNAITNYRNTTHIHIGVPGLKNDLEAILGFFRYIEDNLDYFLQYVVPMSHKPRREDFATPSEYKRARLYHSRQYPWFAHRVPQDRVKKILESTSLREFYVKHFWYNEEFEKYEKLANVKRACINFLSLFYHGTVEFRCWPPTINLSELEDYYEFSDRITRAALWDHSMTIEKIWNSKEWKIPPLRPMIPWMEKSYKKERNKYHRELKEHFFTLEKDFPEYYDEAIMSRWKERFHDF